MNWPLRLVVWLPHDGAITSASDQHYQYVPISSLLQNSANDYTEVRIDNTSSATNSGVATHNEDIEPEFSPNAFGKSSHGVACWDVKRWVFRSSIAPLTEAGQINNLSYGITDDGLTRTAIPTPDDDGYLLMNDYEVKTITGATGEVVSFFNKVQRIDEPMDIIDGTSFHHLLTKSHYRFFLDGTGLPGVVAVGFGILARRVLVPLTEVFFDRETISGLLDAVILESLLN